MLGLIGIGAVTAVVYRAVRGHLDFVQAAAPHRALIHYSADRHGVSPWVLAAILWKESRFDPGAVGSAGEVGMGQFKEIAARDVDVSFSDLKNNPALQIDAAAALLRLNAERLDGDVLASVRSYNVGIGAARSDSTAGAAYATDVFTDAFVDWLYSIFGLRGKSEV